MSPYSWPWRLGSRVPHRVLDGVTMWAQARCILCGQYTWSLADLMDHFSRSHGAVL